MGFIADIFPPKLTSPLVTDKYHLTTAYGYWLEGRIGVEAVFYVHNRVNPNERSFAVAAGLQGVKEVLARWREFGFLDEDINYLRSLRQFPEEFLEFLADMKFELEVMAVPEGTIFFPHEPILRVKGPLIQAKMFESVALAILNGHCAYASHAAAMMIAITKPMQNGSPIGKVSVQGLRRGPSFSAAIEASRSLMLGGYDSTSTAVAAKFLDEPLVGTMDHAWVMSHEHEIAELTIAQLIALRDADQIAYKKALSRDAFRSYAMAFPDEGVLLVDTYDPIVGIDNAVKVIAELRAMGGAKRYGIRFDSGDITALSKVALRKFALAGWVEGLGSAQVKLMSDEELLLNANRCSVFCAASNNIDEQQALKMREQGAYISFWGIGTASSLPPTIGLVYKASLLIEDGVARPLLKVSGGDTSKSSMPGIINSRRFYDAFGKLKFVVIYDELQGLGESVVDESGKVIDLPEYSSSQDVLLPIEAIAGPVITEVRTQIKEAVLLDDGYVKVYLDKKLFESKQKLCAVNPR